MKKNIFIFVLLFVTTISCNSLTKTKGNEIDLRFDWIPTMSFAGDIVAMNKFANKNGISLSLYPAGEGIDPIRMVLSGTNDIGIVGLDKLIMANEKGADLVAIGMIDYLTPTVFISKKEINISSPFDFIGKKVGIQTGGATKFVYRLLIELLEIDATQINEVRIGYDMRPFIENIYDVRPGFIFDEAVYLDINDIEYNLVKPQDYGLNYPGRVYFARRSFINNNTELINKFINSVGEGWKYAINNPESAIKQLQEFESKINFERELLGLEKAKEYFSGYNNQILMPDTVAINQMIDLLYQLDITKSMPSIDDFFNLEFVKNVHFQ